MQFDDRGPAQRNGFHSPIVYSAESDSVNNSYQWRSLFPFNRVTHLIRDKCPWKWQKDNLHKNQSKVDVKKNQICIHDFVEFLPRRTLHSIVVHLPLILMGIMSFCHFHGRLPRLK